MVKHPARYTDSLMPVFEAILLRYKCVSVLDPFAGTGKIHLLPFDTVGIEIEPEWAAMNDRTICADATHLPFADNTFDAICTSPTYGNRMADHHNAKDGSKRLTYTHTLGRSLHGNNTGKMQWGPQYREMHRQAWAESSRVLKKAGVFIVNVSDHIRKGVIQPVTRFHIDCITELGFGVVDHIEVATPRMKYGQHSNVRVGHESVIVFTREGAHK